MHARPFSLAPLLMATACTPPTVGDTEEPANTDRPQDTGTPADTGDTEDTGDTQPAYCDRVALEEGQETIWGTLDEIMERMSVTQQAATWHEGDLPETSIEVTSTAYGSFTYADPNRPECDEYDVQLEGQATVYARTEDGVVETTNTGRVWFDAWGQYVRIGLQNIEQVQPIEHPSSACTIDTGSELSLWMGADGSIAQTFNGKDSISEYECGGVTLLTWSMPAGY